MNGLLNRVIRRFHCHNAHHRVAWDALPLVRTDAGRRLVRLLTRHHRRYLRGAIDPDIRFRDFQNHVIHARDGYWGGAPRVAHAWYERVQRYLRTERYSDAAHACGVLSHYFSDPFHPLHTHHDARERLLHGPIEWSIHRGYDAIHQAWKQGDCRVVFQLSSEPHWLGEAILHGARFANGKFETLLDGYNPADTLDAPLHALTTDARLALIELLGLMLTGWARVLERAAADAERIRNGSLPVFGKTIPFGLATGRAPVQLFVKRYVDSRLRSDVVCQLDEWRDTGNVIESLPTEVDVVHRVVQVRADERRWKRDREQRLRSQRTRILVRPRRRAA